MNAMKRAGRENYLLRQSEPHPVAFMTLFGKLTPTTVAGDLENPLISAPAMTEERVERARKLIAAVWQGRRTGHTRNIPHQAVTAAAEVGSERRSSGCDFRRTRASPETAAGVCAERGAANAAPQTGTVKRRWARESA
jgi:hypothetical protein